MSTPPPAYQWKRCMELGYADDLGPEASSRKMLTPKALFVQHAGQLHWYLNTQEA